MIIGRILYIYEIDRLWGALRSLFDLCAMCRRGERPLEGLTRRDLEEILAYANRAAALTCSRSGAIPAMPTRAEVEGVIES